MVLKVQIVILLLLQYVRNNNITIGRVRKKKFVS